MSEATLALKRPLPLNLLIIACSSCVWVILAAFPFFWTVWGSFKVEVDFFSRESWWNAIFGTNTEQARPALRLHRRRLLWRLGDARVLARRRQHRHRHALASPSSR